MTSLEEAKNRFEQAMLGAERALEAARLREDQHQALVRELAALKTRISALEAENAVLQKSFEAQRRRQRGAANRLDGAITTLRDMLSA